MSFRNFTLIVALVLASAGCDGIYDRRIVVSSPPESLQSTVATVARYAKENGIQCTPHPGTALYCYNQPILVFVLATADGSMVCYLAMGARFERGKFETRIDRLSDMLVKEFGPDSVVVSVPKPSQCMLPRS